MSTRRGFKNAALMGLLCLLGCTLAKTAYSPTPTTSMVKPKAPMQVELPAPAPIRYMPGLSEPLVATDPVSEQENKDLDAALAAFHAAPAKAGKNADFDDYAKPLLAFIATHPNSNWNSAINLNLGMGYYHAGYFSRAFSYYEQAWKLGRNAQSVQAKRMVDRAVAELARMHARIGHEKELEQVLEEMGNRPLSGSAAELMQGAKNGLLDFKHHPGVAYLCGPRALENVLMVLKAKPQQIEILQKARSGEHGFSLSELASLADKVKLSYKLIYRKPGQPIPVPSVINWNVHHYAAIIGVSHGLYVIQDPTFGAQEFLVTAKAIDTEGSGYFLVPTQVANKYASSGWKPVSAHSSEAGKVYGMGDTNQNIQGATQPTDNKMNNCPAGQTPQIVPSNSGCPPQPAMTVVNAHMMIVSLNLTDAPVGYKPQKGPRAQTTITYNQRDDEQPATFSFSNVSPQWTHGWLAYVTDDPNNPGASVNRYSAGGGGYGYNASSYNYSTGSFSSDTHDAEVLTRVPPTGPLTQYVHLFADGSQEIYATSNGALTYPRLIFLTQVIDPQGNAVTINYDSQFRITSIMDAMGRSSTFSYGLAGYPLLITKITDPFGRYAQMTYDTSQRLASITDPIGITSSFTYSPTEPTFITQLTTPYGNSYFSDLLPSGDVSEVNTRALTMKDPLGYTDFLYFYEKPLFIPDSDPVYPCCMGITNQYLEYRNTYYFDRHAFPIAVTLNGDGTVNTENPLQSRITHWTHDRVDFPNVTGRVVESIQLPLENRVWYNYPQQPLPQENGFIDRPSAAGRVLDDGVTTQLSTATYIAYNGSFGGKPTSLVDPKGRTRTFTYASNSIDLQTVNQLTSPGTYTPVGTYGSYNSQHEPQTYTGADGQTWHYTYNPAGQLSTVTDPNTGVTTYNYDSVGRLSTVQNANLATVLTLTYDSADRVLTRTDSEGYTLTYSYDNLDRVTKITYPDTTTDQYDYTFQSGPLMGMPSLELRKHTDRLGRITTYTYDADRRLLTVTEPISGGTNRTTTYDYYENGTLEDIIDANGNDTHWAIDIQSRPISKTYGYGTPSPQTETYTYENTTSRLHSITDALGQVKTFTYDTDDRITGITYSSTVNPTPNITFAWDTYFPRLTTMTDGLGTTNYSYTPIGTDGALKLASTDGPFSNDAIGLTYDALGRLYGRTIPGGNETFSYDAISRLTSHVSPVGNATYGYLGQTDQTTLRRVLNGTILTVSTGWGYDTNTNDRRLISITNSGVTRSYTLGYGSSPVNVYDIMAITDTAAAGHPWATQSHSYTYDEIDRLLTASATTPGNFAYGYDPVDNATTVTTPSGTTNPTYNGFNQINTWGSLSYSYDADGNLLSGDGVHTYKWDAENRLIEIDYVGTGNKSVFSYDGLGHRTVDAETVGGTTTTTRYLWCGSRICQKRSGTDTVLRRFLDEGEYNPVAITHQKLIYMPDQLGSVRDLIDATTGNLLQSYDYTPYGGVARSAGGTPTGYQYASLFAHTQSGLNLATYRAQDGITGRWINRDPIRENGGINLYEYVKANTINYFDPEGLLTLQIGGAFGGSFWGFNFSYGGGFAIDDKGNIGSYIYGEGGTGVGLGGSAGISVMGSTADTICGLGGPFANLGGSAGLGLNGSVDYFEGVQSNGKPVYGWGGGAGGGGGVETYGGGSQTRVRVLGHLW